MQNALHAPPVPVDTVDRAALYRAMAPHGLTPLWEVLHALVPAEPAVRTRPCHWRWADVQPFLARAGRAISAEEAVRRVLILENPGWAGESRVTGSLYAGLQLILPGEVAPPHRHSQSALRFVVEGSGASTTVDGARIAMEPGDFVITPAWTWHAHGNDGDAPVVWLDGLDIPTVAFFEAGFAEQRPPGPDEAAAADGAVAAAPALSDPELAPPAGPLLRPLHAAPRAATPNPVVHYPYARSREALAELARRAAPDPVHGHALAYTNPLTGGPAMPTIGTRLQWLPAGFHSAPWRSTAGTVYCVVEGSARFTVRSAATGDHAYAVGAKDQVVVPPWHVFEILAQQDCVLFAFDDAPLQRAAGLLRESAGPAA